VSQYKFKSLSLLLICIFIVSCAGPVTVVPDNVTDNTVAVQNPVDSYTGKVRNGEPAPDFSLPDINGNMVMLSALRGKKVVINLWWIRCHGCTEEMPFFQEFYEKYSGQDMELIAINGYEKEAVVKSYSDGKNFTFTVISDSNKQLNKGYTDWGVPTTFFIDEEGIIRARKDAGFISVEEIEEFYNSY
jgi:cytochrome c biogenesis protein CcmG/thiol:disulfide interchange protein DsbE